MTGASHRVIDHRIAFRSADAPIVAAIDGFLGATASDDAPTLVFDVDRDPAGQVGLHADDERRFADLDSLVAGLPMLLNLYATWTHHCVALHAGAVRSPSGEVVVLAAPPGSGKSTLTAALVAEGWDYLSDEAVGIRPGSLAAVGYPKRLSLDLAGRELLGLAPDVGDEVDPAALRADVACLSGDVGAIGRVILPRFVEGAAVAFESLSPADAARELIANTFNLARVGQSGLDTICALAETIPVECLRYGDARDVASSVLSSRQ